MNQISRRPVKSWRLISVLKLLLARKIDDQILKYVLDIEINFKVNVTSR